MSGGPLPEPAEISEGRSRRWIAFCVVGLVSGAIGLLAGMTISDRSSDSEESVVASGASGADDENNAIDETEPPEEDLPAGGGGTISFVNWDGENSEMFVIGADGTNISQPIGVGEEVWCGSLSPSGDQLAVSLAATFSDSAALYVVDTDGTNPTSLSEPTTDWFCPGWSPDGTSIFFFENVDDSARLLRVNATGGPLASIAEFDGRGYCVSLSPDGDRLAFDLEEDGTAQIFTMKADGSGLAQVTDHPDGGFCPRWSPTGEQLLFERWTSTGDASDPTSSADLFIVRSDGSDERQLTVNDDYDSCPEWSPDGTHIVFSSTRHSADPDDDSSEIFIMDIAGGGEPESLGVEGCATSWAR